MAICSSAWSLCTHVTEQLQRAKTYVASIKWRFKSQSKTFVSVT